MDNNAISFGAQEGGRGAQRVAGSRSGSGVISGLKTGTKEDGFVLMRIYRAATRVVL